jgi:hypothetical protein
MQKVLAANDNPSCFACSEEPKILLEADDIDDQAYNIYRGLHRLGSYFAHIASQELLPPKHIRALEDLLRLPKAFNELYSTIIDQVDGARRENERNRDKHH